MKSRPMDPVTFGFERGVDTRSRETRLPAGAVRDARNVDISREGNVLRRRGWRQLIAATNAHSLWADPRWPWLLYIDAGTLVALDPQGLSTENIGAIGDYPTSFCWHGGEVFLTNALNTLRLDEQLMLRTAGVSTPPLPLIAIVTSGVALVTTADSASATADTTTITADTA